MNTRPDWGCGVGKLNLATTTRCPHGERIMMKRATVCRSLSIQADDQAQTQLVIPPGPCWIIEGALWVTLFWDGPSDREAFELTARDYEAYVKDGCIELSPAASLRMYGGNRSSVQRGNAFSDSR